LRFRPATATASPDRSLDAFGLSDMALLRRAEPITAGSINMASCGGWKTDRRWFYKYGSSAGGRKTDSGGSINMALLAEGGADGEGPVNTQKTYL
jgi:hypothetical protein